MGGKVSISAFVLGSTGVRGQEQDFSEMLCWPRNIGRIENMVENMGPSYPPIKISKNSVFVLQPSVRPFRGIVHGVEPGSDDRGRGADMPQRGSDAADALERAEQASHDERAAINICCSRSTSFF